MILTVTPNTALDRIELVPHLVAGQVLRSSEVVLSPGGKGVNVARAIKNLGGEATCTGFLGGLTGQLHSNLVRQEAIHASWTWIETETRAAIVIIDQSTSTMTVINEQGPSIKPADWERLESNVLQLAEQTQTVCLCGSLPVGIKPDAYRILVANLNRMGRSVWVDASGPFLKAAVQSRPAVVKVNGLEASILLGWNEVVDIPGAVKAARAIQQAGIGMVVITLGKEGAILVSEAGTWVANPPRIHAICPIGSGDAFLGGMVLALHNRVDASDALRTAVAAGSANALSFGGGKLNQIDFDIIYTETTVKKYT